eukprot:137502-Rhodomonas_salina.1
MGRRGRETDAADGDHEGVGELELGPQRRVPHRHHCLVQEIPQLRRHVVCTPHPDSHLPGPSFPASRTHPAPGIRSCRASVLEPHLKLTSRARSHSHARVHLVSALEPPCSRPDPLSISHWTHPATTVFHITGNAITYGGNRQREGGFGAGGKGGPGVPVMRASSRPAQPRSDGYKGRRQRRKGVKTRTKALKQEVTGKEYGLAREGQAGALLRV